MKRVSILVVALLLLVIGAAPSLAQDRPIEIEFVHIFGGENDSRAQVIQSIADAFMAERTDVQVTLSSPSNDYTELFNAALLSAQQGSAPEIVLVEEGLTQLAYDSQLFIPIEGVASAEQLASLEDVLPQLLNFYRIQGALWSMPWNASNPILYYNRGMFEAAGLDPDAPPATFDDILTACAAIMALPEDTRPSAGCINWPMATWMFEQWTAMQNGMFVNNDNGRSARAGEALADPVLNGPGDVVHHRVGRSAGERRVHGDGKRFDVSGRLEAVERRPLARAVHADHGFEEKSVGEFLCI